MPRYDGTGPWWGYGPGTGRGFGPCTAGMDWGPRAGRWWRKKFYGMSPFQPELDKKEEKELLEQEAVDLEEEIKEIKKRLSQLKNQK